MEKIIKYKVKQLIEIVMIQQLDRCLYRHLDLLSLYLIELLLNLSTENYFPLVVLLCANSEMEKQI